MAERFRPNRDHVACCWRFLAVVLTAGAASVVPVRAQCSTRYVAPGGVDAGNTCTEDLVAVLEEMGVRTGVDLGGMIEAGRRAEEVLGQRLRSNVVPSGPVIHGESSPVKEAGVSAAPP